MQFNWLHALLQRKTVQRKNVQREPARQRSCRRLLWLEAFAIARIDLEAEAAVPGIDDANFQKQALDAKQNCPVSKALAGTAIQLNAKLL